MKKTLTAIALSAMVAGAAVPALAQMEAPATPPAATSESPLASPSAIAPATGEFRAGNLIGTSVTNSVGETVGEVEDLVIGADSKVSAAIVSVGGFLGVGDKLVAIALSDLQVTPEKDGDYQILVAATKDELNAMPEVELN